MERHDVAAELARELYEPNDVDILPGHWLVESAEPKIEEVDGGYWVQARVFVDAESVEARLRKDDEPEMTDLTFEVTIQVPAEDDGEGIPTEDEIDYAIVQGGVAPNENVTVQRK